ncbi:glutathione S-transferase family protein [Maritimibacter sp. DP1N21-5]|uniref:glutathione S-transferase family protein n=1 Tax=Maritimibacter sp. DP1N21-5 TaxID=2836867 RepID=UPI001C495C8B|nr:glutathione S-transferase family protein [Maritimibacter sp. DP1N21-5]MBV7410894.1 glutathione S-transferase family protein [Maritimibacter sp. DP1N21-5]
MQLLGSPASPFVRKVLVTLRETDQLDQIDFIEVSTTPTNSASEVTAAHALKKIPALIRPDGCTLYDSRVITRFLDGRARGKLYPERNIWEVLTLEATGDGIMEAAVLMVYEGRVRPEEKQFEGWVEAQWGKIENALDALSARWMSHLYGPLDAGQISVGCALGYLDFRHPTRDWRKGRDGLAAWYAEFSTRDAMAATSPA